MEEAVGMVGMADLAGIVIGAIAIGVSLFAVFFSHKAAKNRQRSAAYADLDSLYLDVLKIGMQYPDFRAKEKTCNYEDELKDRLIEYETYAYLVWNVCETVYDQTEGKGENWKTWKPVIVEENSLHRQWFDDNTKWFDKTDKADYKNPPKFKSAFVKRINEEFGPPSNNP